MKKKILVITMAMALILTSACSSKGDSKAKKDKDTTTKAEDVEASIRSIRLVKREENIKMVLTFARISRDELSGFEPLMLIQHSVLTGIQNLHEFAVIIGIQFHRRIVERQTEKRVQDDMEGISFVVVVIEKQLVHILLKVFKCRTREYRRVDDIKLPVKVRRHAALEERFSSHLSSDFIAVSEMQTSAALAGDEFTVDDNVLR